MSAALAWWTAAQRVREAEDLLLALRAHYVPRGWAGDDGALAAQAVIEVQALIGVLDVLRRRAAREHGDGAAGDGVAGV